MTLRLESKKKGCYRQFYQVGVECFGIASADIDVELIILSARLWKRLGLLDYVELQRNNIGLASEREAYKAFLVDYLTELKKSFGRR